jgi:hypothetical protein
MRDTLEDQLAARLRALAGTVDDELPTPVDLELRVRRHLRKRRAGRRWSGLAVATAAAVVAIAVVAVSHGTTGSDAIRVTTSPTATKGSVRDSLAPGTVMLAARGRFVQSLDPAGVGNATMVKAHPGSNVTYARVTADHRALWYLSFKDGPNACGEVVRANIDGQTSKIITKAAAFDISPDGRRLAMYGAGNLADGECKPVKRGAVGQIAVVDVATFQSSTVSMSNVTNLRWSPDGSYVVAVSCSDLACGGFRRINVPGALGSRLSVDSGAMTYPTATIDSASVEFGPDGLYALETTTPLGVANAKPSDLVALVDPTTLLATRPIFSGGTAWHISQVIPTSSGTYVVATHLRPAGAEKSKTAAIPGLYKLVDGHLVEVGHGAYRGTLTPVTPLAPTG